MKQDVIKAYANGALSRFWDDETQNFEQFVVELITNVTSRDLRIFQENANDTNRKNSRKSKKTKIKTYHFLYTHTMVSSELDKLKV